MKTFHKKQSLNLNIEVIRHCKLILILFGDLFLCIISIPIASCCLNICHKSSQFCNMILPNFVGMFTVYLHFIFHKSRCNFALVNAVKRKAKCKFCIAAVLLLCTVLNRYTKKNTIIFKDILSHNTSRTYIK
jgi:hypothetical protein